MCCVSLIFRLACRCAKESSANGYNIFGLQHYGECWSDPQAADRFDIYGKSGGCKSFGYKNCDDQVNHECVGTRNNNYVYRIVGDGGKEKQPTKQTNKQTHKQTNECCRDRIIEGKRSIEIQKKKDSVEL